MECYIDSNEKLMLLQNSMDLINLLDVETVIFQDI